MLAYDGRKALTGVHRASGPQLLVGDVVAEYYQIELSGMAEFDRCSDFSSLDGVCIMGPMQQICSDGDPIACSYGMLIPSICADSDEPGCYGVIGLQFYQAFGAFHLLVTLQTSVTPCGQGGGQPAIEWQKDFAPSAPDCLFLDEFGVPQHNRSPGSRMESRRPNSATAAARRAS